MVAHQPRIRTTARNKAPDRRGEIRQKRDPDHGWLESARLPRGLERIETCCFSDSGVEEIRLPDTLRSIAGNAFENCHSLRTVFAAESCARDIRNSADGVIVVLLK